MPRPPFPRPQHYAVAQEQLRHDDAVHWFGEMTAFIQWWHISDFEDGLVARCERCFGGGVIHPDVAEAFKQPTNNKCSVCYGTTFQGGYKQIVYCPAIWAPGPESSEAVGRRGETKIRGTQVQPVSTVKLRDGDSAVRLDNTRWRLASPVEAELSTGFGFHGIPQENMRSAVTANLQDDTAVDYLVPIDFPKLDTEGPWEPVIVPGYEYPVGPTPSAGSEGYVLFRDTVHDDDDPFGIAANAWTIVPIDGLGFDSVGAPQDASQWWRENRFRPPQAGDFYSLTLTFEIRSPILGREVEVELARTGQVLYRDDQTLTYPDAPEPASFTAKVMVTPELVTEGAFWRVRVNGIATIQNISVMIRREYRA